MSWCKLRAIRRGISTSCSLDVDRPRVNEINIQLLSESLQQQIFGKKQCPGSKEICTIDGTGEEVCVQQEHTLDRKKLETVKKHLSHHKLWNKQTALQKDVNFHLPPLLGKNIDEHFTNLGRKQIKDYVELSDRLCASGIPKLPSEWAFCPGWVKYDEEGIPIPVDYPEERVIVFDVETIVQEGNYPAMATAVSDKYCFSVKVESLEKFPDERIYERGLALLKKKPKSLAAFKEDVQWATGEQRFISDSGEKNPHHYATDSEFPHDPIDQDEDPQDMHDHVDDSGDQQSLMSDNNSPHNPVNHHEDVDYMYDNEAANTDYKHDNLADTGSPHDPIDQHEEQVYTGDNVLDSDRQLEPADQHKSPQDMHDHLDDSGDQQSLMSDNNSPHNPVNHHEDVDYMYDNEAANTDYIHDNLADTGSPHDPIDQHEEQVYTGDNVLDSDRQLKSPQDMHDHLDDSCDSDSCASTIWPCLGRFCKPGSPEEIVDSEEEVNPPKRRRLDHDNIAQSEKVSDTNNPEIFEKITDINNSEIFVRKIIFSKTFNDKQKKNDRVQNSVHACYFCDIVRSHIQDHLLRKHSDQKEIMDIIKRGNDKNEQENLKSLIRAKGNHKHNLNVISEKKGELILFRRPKENFDSAQFGPCPKCLEWMMCKSLPKHQKTCKGYSQEGDEFVPKKSYLQAMSDFKKGIIKKEVSPALLKEVFTIMRTDNVGVVAKSDGLIIDLGEKWLKSCIDNPTKRPYWASQHMRHAAKLLIELRMLDRADAEKDKTPLEDEEKCLWEFLRPAYFDNIVKASLNTALPDFDDIDDLKSPSNALKIKYDIITMAERKASKSNQKYDKTNLPEWKQSKKEAEGLLAEITREWKNKVTKVAKKVLLERKVMKKEQLPHPRDIEKLAKYLKEELVNADLSKSTVTWPYYKQLCKYAQTRLMSYNKRRSGEVENVTVKNYMNKLQMDDIDEGLIGEITQLERYLMETHDLIQVRGKKSSVVPMLIPPECTSVINFLADREVRSRVGINPKNDYLFPNKDVASIRAYDSLSEICAECQLQKPERISSTSMRKYMATVSQVMNLDPNQLQWVCRHLGHTQKVHLNNYRAMSPYLERVKIGKMLLLQELNLQAKFAGKNPDDIDFFDLLQDNASTVQDNAATNEDNLHADQSATGIFEVEPTAVETEPLDDEEDAVSVVESDVSVEEVTSKKSSICKKLSMKKRQKWTIEEEKEIRKYFQKNLERKITPGKVECVKAKQLSLKAGGELHKRYWHLIVKKVSAMIRKYSWCSDNLVTDKFRWTSDVRLQELIPLESTTASSRTDGSTSRLVIGHNVAFDRSFVKEQYYLEKSKLRFMDTMSMHIAVCGLTNLQRTLYQAAKNDSQQKIVKEYKQRHRQRGAIIVEDWKEMSSLNNLADVHQLHVGGGKIDKDPRNIFVEGSTADVRDNFQELMNYCAGDVRATFEVFRVLWPEFNERFPHPVTLSGMLEMATGYLPVNQNWERYIHQSNVVYKDMERESKQLLMRLANDACEQINNESYKKDPWLWDLDWTTKQFKLKKEKKLTKKQQQELEKPKAEGESEEESCLERVLQQQDRHYKTNGFMSGYPEWYRLLCSRVTSEEWCPGPHKISHQMRVTPKLLRLTWDGFPLHFDDTHGWGYLVPGRTDNLEEPVLGPGEEQSPERLFPYKELCEIMQLEVEKSVDVDDNEEDDQESIDMTDEEFEAKMDKMLSGVEGNKVGRTSYKHRKEMEEPVIKPLKKQRARKQPDHTGDGPHNSVNIPGCWFFKIPHKDGKGKRVGNPLAKDYLNRVEDGTLSAQSGPGADMVLKLNKASSYWKMNRKRIESQMPVWLTEDELSEQVRQAPNFVEGSHLGAIVPRIVPAGTITRRGVEPTWLTASNAYVDRIGSELKSMVQAPPGYCFVGADVDSQELWIGAILGDANFGKTHGCTALGWMTLQGSKKEGTDLHSVVANTVSISRDHAKVFNYGRIYGAGQLFAQKLLLQFNHRLTIEEARQKAQLMFSTTKGRRSRQTGKWDGGSESAMFNKLEEIARLDEPCTPVLGCRISKALEPENVDEDFMTSRINWVVQSSAVDYLHLMLTCMHWLCEEYDINGRFSISIHDEVRYLVAEEDCYRAALALQITNLLTRAIFAYKLGLKDLPLSVAFFSAVDIDQCLRKEVNLDCVTPSNPHGLEEGYQIPHGIAFDIHEILEKTGGCLGRDTPKMEKEMNPYADIGMVKKSVDFLQEHSEEDETVAGSGQI